MDGHGEYSRAASRGRWRGGRSRGRIPRGGYSPNSRSAPWEKHSAVADSSTISLPRGSLIQRLKARDLDNEATRYVDVARITDVKFISSYNWIDAQVPTIMIPGSPPRWTPPTKPSQLTEDAGVYYRDINAAHYPSHPTEPAVVAGLAADSSLPCTTDIVTCGSVLGNLLRYVSGVHKPFRILAENVNGTLFLVRRENAPDERIEGVYGYGHTFPEAYTTWDADVRGSSSHQRLLQYKFGNLGIAVFFEVDGYLAEDDDKHKEKGRSKQERGGTSMENLITGLDGLATDGPKVSNSLTRPTAAAVDLTICHGGYPIDSSSALDIKTRTERKRSVEDTVSMELPRLWVRQIKHFVLAYHTHGRFHDVQILPMQEKMLVWESDPQHQAQLCRLAALLHRLIRATLSAPGQRMEVILTECKNSPKQRLYGPSIEELELEFCEQLPGVESALSPAVQEKWKEGLNKTVVEREEEWVGNSEDQETVKDSAYGYSHGKGILGGDVEWDDASEPDFTACSADSCGYCGKCVY